MADDDTWPPEQPTSLLIHHQRHHTPEQVTAMAELMCTGDIGKVALVTNNQSTIKHAKLYSLQEAIDTSRTTKEIKEILAPLENNEDSSFILIEGAPGIGKTVLLKEITYR